MAAFVRLNVPMKVNGRDRSAGEVVEIASSLASALCRPGNGGASRLQAGELAGARKEAAKLAAENVIAREKAKAKAVKKEAAKK